MKTSALKITVDTKELRQTLERLPANLNERVRKKGARKALAPLTKEMAALWRSATYRGGKAVHRRAIASATQLDIRRTGGNATAPLRSRIGVRYGTKGGARAKGRQRVYHLLELGFQHVGGKRVPGAFRSLAWATRSLQKAANAMAAETLAEAKRLLEGKP